jgi:uncharacterized protein YcbK (DUF882 family)
MRVTVKRDRYLTKHFRYRELACKCRRADCDAKEMDAYFLSKLEALRLLWNKPLNPTSGARCGIWNAKQGGAPKSQHVEGKAADFWFEDTQEMKAFVEMAKSLGFTGIGRGLRHLVHLDTRDGELVTWIYKDK